MSGRGVTRKREHCDGASALLEEPRDRVLVFLRAASQRQADRCPSEAEWSISEIADHLALTERAYVGGVAELAAIDTSPAP